jgi:uncharacterized repeat protein (TIGR02543 family)
MVLGICASAMADQTAIFSDDFESAFAGWTKSANPSWYTGDPRIGTHSVKLPKKAAIQRTVSTVGWQDITVSFWLGADLVRSGATVQALWFNGTTWIVLKQFRTGDPDEDGNLHYFEFALAPAANNNAKLALRFKANSKLPRDAGYVDNVMVTAAGPLMCSLDLDGAGGSVKVNGVTQSLPLTDAFAYGATVLLQAAADAGYHFTGWSGDLTGSANPASILMDGDKEITANFAVDTYTLAIASGTGHGSVKVDGVEHALPWAGTFDSGASVSLEAIPEAGYRFAGWAGGLTGAANPAAITMDGDQEVSAGFATDTYVLHLSGNGGGVKVDSVYHALPDTVSVAYDSVVTLESSAAEGWHFVGWSGDLSGAADPTPLLMDSDKSVTVGFALNQYLLTLSGTGSGSVTVNGADCALPWSGTFAHGDIVALEAVPASGSHFTSWVGGLTGAANPTFLVMDSAKDVTAAFGLNTYTLTISGTDGIVKLNGAPRALPWTGPFAAGEAADLEAVPVLGYHFVSWSGDLTGSANPTTITMDGDRQVSAEFAVDSCTLTVLGTHGSLNVDDVAQTLPYSASYDYGTVVSLEAVADPGYHFAGWSGDLTGTTNPVDVTVAGDQTITANFAPGLCTLSLTGSGGTVKVNGIAQSLPWSGQYDSGTVVSLEAVPDTGYQFVGWSGDLTGTESPVDVTINGDKTITANFRLLHCTLTLTGSGGMVKVDGVAQSLPWSGEYDYGTNVTLEAVPDSCTRFSGWSGDLLSADNPAVIALDGDKAVTAGFESIVIFSDVDCSYWAAREIAACFVAGIVGGYPDGTYRPSLTVTRDQMAVYISRALAGGDAGVPPGPAQASFSDVPVDYWAFKYVEYAKVRLVVQGYWDGTYDPTGRLDRGQMAVFIARAIAGGDANVPAGPATPTFPDVSVDFWAYKYVEYIAQDSLGIVHGYSDGLYHPEYPCTRDQMAVYVQRAFELPL